MARKKYETWSDAVVTDPNFYKDDIEEMYEAADEVKQLGDKVNAELNEVFFDHTKRIMQPRGTLTFASQALEVLSDLRMNRANIIDKAISQKLKVAQMVTNNKKLNDATVDEGAIAKAFNRIFIENQDRFLPKNSQAAVVQRSMSQVNEADDSELESRIEQLESSGELQFTDNELAIKYEARGGVEFKVVDSATNPSLVACTKDNGEIIPDYPPTLIPKEDLSTGTFKDGKVIMGSGKEFTVLS